MRRAASKWLLSAVKAWCSRALTNQERGLGPTDQSDPGAALQQPDPGSQIIMSSSSYHHRDIDYKSVKQKERNIRLLCATFSKRFQFRELV